MVMCLANEKWAEVPHAPSQKSPPREGAASLLSFLLSSLPLPLIPSVLCVMGSLLSGIHMLLTPTGMIIALTIYSPMATQDSHGSEETSQPGPGLHPPHLGSHAPCTLARDPSSA